MPKKNTQYVRLSGSAHDRRAQFRALRRSHPDAKVERYKVRGCSLKTGVRITLK